VFVNAVFEAAVNGAQVETALIPAVRHRPVQVASSLPVGDDASPDHRSTATMIFEPTHWTAPAAGDGVVGVGAVLTHQGNESIACCSTHCWLSSSHIQSPSGIGIGGCHTPSMRVHDGYGDGGTICPSMYIQPGPHFGESTHRPPRLSVAHWWSPTMTRRTSSCSLSSAAYVLILPT
jgi:hypothetical protein